MAKFLSLTILLLLLAVVPAKAEEAKNTLLVRENEVLSAVKKEFVEEGLDDEIDVEIFAGQASFILENAKTAKLMVSKLKYDEMQNKFDCDLDVFADGKHLARTQLQGRYYILDDIAVPLRNIAKGEVLKPADLKMIKVRQNRIKPNHVISLDKLTDMEAKRSLKEGRPVSDREVGQTKLIKKGDMVTMVYKTDKMQITTKAEALSDGARGDKIEAVNTKSKKKLYGTVIDSDTIEVNNQ